MNFKTNRSNCEIYSHYPSDTHPCAFIQLVTQFNLSLNGTRAAQSPNIVFKLPSAASCRLLSSVEPYAGETEFLSSQSTPVNPLSRSQYTTNPPVAVPPEGSAYISIPSDAWYAFTSSYVMAFSAPLLIYSNALSFHHKIVSPCYKIPPSPDADFRTQPPEFRRI